MDVKWNNSIDTQDFIRECLPHIDEHNLARYIKVTGKIWEIFEVKKDEQSWMIAKSHHEIQDFILDFNISFKTKLLFGQFMMKGVHQICKIQEAISWKRFAEFLQIDDFQLKKIKSMKLLKKSGGRYKDQFCCKLPWQWQQRDFVIINSGVLYFSTNKEAKQYLPFDTTFKILYGTEQTGYQLGIRLESNHRKLLLYANNFGDYFKFLYFIRNAQKSVSTDTENRYMSFSPIRLDNRVQFFVDGQDYFLAVAEGLSKAERQIMICGWYISPQFQLVRPVSEHIDQRLDYVLKRAADRGIKVFILIYNESSFLTNDSTYVKLRFEALSPLIKVLQHPLGVLPTFWSHHEKLVIVDQQYAYMGGLDMGFARYDNSSHRIDHNDIDYYPGLQYNNVRKADLTKVRQFWVEGISRQQARLPWHDVGLYVAGEAVSDLCHHFIQYWNYASFQTHYQDRYILIIEKDRPKQPFLKRIGQGITKQFKTIKKFAGEIKDKIFKKQPEQNIRNAHEIGQNDIKIDVIGAQSSSNSSKKLKQQDSSHTNNSPANFKNGKIELMKQSQFQQPQEIQSIDKLRLKHRSIVQIDSMVDKMEDQIQQINFIDGIRVKKLSSIDQKCQEKQYSYSCQVVRSVGSWSIGCNPANKQRSIHSAYIDLIRQSKRFIYIENQYFISAVAGDSVVNNEISNEIYKRVLTAFLKKQQFKVFIFTPLIPGFAGQLDDADAVIPRVIMHWQYYTISRSQGSLLVRIANLGVDPSNYITFYGLRTHGMVADQPQTEIVYLHSKLMIVDDCKAICGSANINDRSMKGSRDSQLCLVVEGGPQIGVVCGEAKVMVSQGIHNLRVRLFTQHFGQGIDVTDPLNSQFAQVISQRTRNNTNLYRDIFGCYPDDKIRTLKQLTQLKDIKCNSDLYHKKKDQIIGFAVQYPLHFLQQEDLLLGSSLYPDSLSI